MKACTLILVLFGTLAARPAAQAQAHGAPHEHHAPHDSAFAEMQRRGEKAMGADQYTSSHVFETLANGGRIALQAAPADTQAVASIRVHFRTIATAFARGDFAVPGFVHASEVPGTRVMTARRKVIRYVIRDLPRGAELQITTNDPKARQAVAQFLAFQRGEHRTAGK
ncbi:MAG: hypothetical protein H7Z74_00180 [Anaerolineae bacterium]|nr:hypothetical protein [Gemmatimonadaceae bacterium]